MEELLQKHIFDYAVDRLYTLDIIAHEIGTDELRESKEYIVIS